MHATTLKSIDRARKHGMWRDSDVTGKGKPLVASQKFTTPKDKDGLGLKKFKMMIEALLVKHLIHKFYNKVDVPWVQLIWSTQYANGPILHATADKGSFLWRGCDGVM
jgi:hypothetical protein